LVQVVRIGDFCFTDVTDALFDNSSFSSHD